MGDLAFKRMQEQFPGVDLNKVAKIAEEAKGAKGLSGSGGDPDLFVFRPGSNERFFVEVKDKDELHVNQLVCFPLIEELLNCPVRVARVRESKASDPRF